MINLESGATWSYFGVNFTKDRSAGTVGGKNIITLDECFKAYS
jgi:hypothetical protein